MLKHNLLVWRDASATQGRVVVGNVIETALSQGPLRTWIPLTETDQ